MRIEGTYVTQKIKPFKTRITLYINIFLLLNSVSNVKCYDHATQMLKIIHFMVQSTTEFLNSF